ncbi:cupin domain-containing protein [Algoriphagus sp. Y33]|uniref:cupin domain-containing protein n=1 Tax=Algoriphagus sp. Y33 TaxID=2772483 RepID=UPI0017807961|nr:cupin domain-containing protein [Algoriphagus sp. Y33]
MSTDIHDYIVQTSSTKWSPLVEKGIDCTGISWMPLRFDEEGKRPVTFLLKFEQGSRYPYHNHPGGEEILVLEGGCEIEGTAFRKGDYLYTPANFKHAVASSQGCTLFLMVPQEVQIL